MLPVSVHRGKARFDKGLSEREEWWRIDDKTDLEALHTQIQDVLVKADQWFQTFQTKESTVHIILDGTAEQYSIACVMHYWTARLLVDMGIRMKYTKQLGIQKQTSLLSWQIIFAGIDLRLSVCE